MVGRGRAGRTHPGWRPLLRARLFLNHLCAVRASTESKPAPLSSKGAARGRRSHLVVSTQGIGVHTYPVLCHVTCISKVEPRFWYQPWHVATISEGCSPTGLEMSAKSVGELFLH